jgi:hypothetical protein
MFAIAGQTAATTDGIDSTATGSIGDARPSAKTRKAKPLTYATGDHHPGAGAEEEETKVPHNSYTDAGTSDGAALQAPYLPVWQDGRHQKPKHHHRRRWRANPSKKM